MAMHLQKFLTAAMIWAGLLPQATYGAETLRYAHGYARQSTVGVIADDWAASIADRTGGALKIRVFPMSLLSLSEAGPGLRDGLTDIAYVVTAYSAQDYPRYLLMQDLMLTLNLRPDTGKESVAYAGAVIEYTMKKCPACLEEFASQNQVYLAGATSSLNTLICRKPVKTLDDMKGLKVRGSLASVVRYLASVGSQAIAFPAQESYEGLSQGVADCTALSMPDLSNMGLQDVATHITTGFPFGLASSVAVGNVNKEVWKDLDPAAREVLIWAAANLSADITWGYHHDAIENDRIAREAGIEMVAAEPALTESLASFAKADIETVIEYYQTHFKVSDAAQIANDFTALLDEWIPLVQSIENRDQLRELFRERIYNDIDPAGYGL